MIDNYEEKWYMIYHLHYTYSGNIYEVYMYNQL